MINKQRGIGLIGLLIIIVIIVLILSYYGVNLRGIVEADLTQENFAYLRAISADFWQAQIVPLLGYLGQAFNNLKNGLK